MQTRLACLVACVALIQVGCQKATPPQTYPVSGEVFRRGKPLPGTIQFVHQTEPNVRAVGEISSDGKFTLSTLVGSEKYAGAVAGDYKAVIVVSAQEPPIQSPRVFKVEPGENAFKIEIP